MFRLAFITLVIFTLSQSVLAEPKRGRLPDGRAYRIDAAGNELVDYVAELEVTNDSYKQRIFGLEDEIKEKNEAIERLKTTGNLNPDIQERTLFF